MRRLALILLATIAAGGAAVALTSSSRGAGGPYLVRGIFDDAVYAVRGEDVRIAGASVGTITALDVTPDNKAAVTLEIDDAGFAPVHAKAHCTIRPQSLIGEEYVDCDPGTAAAPPLRQIRRGPGTGSYLLPVTRTSSPIDSDIVQNIYQQPVREALAVIIDEFGTGLAARGSDLNAVIHRANPALGYTDQVLQILARQNRTLAQLAIDRTLFRFQQGPRQVLHAGRASPGLRFLPAPGVRGLDRDREPQVGQEDHQGPRQDRRLPRLGRLSSWQASVLDVVHG